jgi:SAM-dependent methyltransferase
MNYQDQLNLQVENSKTPTAKEFLNGLYSELIKELKINEEYLEIGAGAGISAFFLQNYKVIRTDILPWGDGLVLGGVNAAEIPYKDKSFAGVFGVDMLHHMEFPYQVIKECMRVTKKKGKIVFIEPYVSLFSYSIYKIFHTEKTSIVKRISPKKPAIGSEPEDGDQRICQSIFLTRRGRAHLQSEITREFSIKKYYIHPLSFFSTGGLSKPLKTNPKIIYQLQKFEAKLPKWFLRLTASRIVVVLVLDD